MKINHHITFSGPAFIPVSTDETSARETTGGATADVGVTPYDNSLADAKTEVNVGELEDGF